MKLTLQGRIQLTLLGAGVLVAFIGVMAFHYLNDLSADLQRLLAGEIAAAHATVQPRAAVADRQAEARRVASRAQQHMVLVMGVTLLAMVILAVLAPPRVVVPLRRIVSALRQAREGRFDTEISLSGTAELSAIGEAVNSLIREAKLFDALKTDRIQLEMRKLDGLANLLDRPVFVTDAEGRVLQASNAFYSLFDIASNEVLGQRLAETRLPAELAELVGGSLAREERLARETFFALAPGRETTLEKTLQISSALVRDHRKLVACGIFVLEERVRADRED
ncbi:MAG: HAMP domain-containing protein [Candidatus Wallbacteria bacterium]|nr:HAMP domain-containing protein [Candidatus Wallbacteria bacterium]